MKIYLFIHEHTNIFKQEFLKYYQDMKVTAPDLNMDIKREHKTLYHKRKHFWSKLFWFIESENYNNIIDWET